MTTIGRYSTYEPRYVYGAIKVYGFGFLPMEYNRLDRGHYGIHYYNLRGINLRPDLTLNVRHDCLSVGN